MSLLVATTISFLIIVRYNSKIAWQEPLEMLDYGDDEMISAYQEALTDKE